MSGFLHAWSASGHSVCVFVCARGRKAPVHNYADLQIIKLIWLCFNSSTRPVFSARSLSFVFLPTARNIRRKYVNVHSEQFSFALRERYKSFYSTEQIWVNDYNSWSPNELTNKSIDSNDSFGTNLSEWIKYLLKYSKRHSPVANCLSHNESMNKSTDSIDSLEQIWVNCSNIYWNTQKDTHQSPTTGQQMNQWTSRLIQTTLFEWIGVNDSYIHRNMTLTSCQLLVTKLINGRVHSHLFK